MVNFVNYKSNLILKKLLCRDWYYSKFRIRHVLLKPRLLSNNTTKSLLILNIGLSSLNPQAYHFSGNPLFTSAIQTDRRPLTKAVQVSQNNVDHGADLGGEHVVRGVQQDPLLQLQLERAVRSRQLLESTQYNHES